MFGEPGGGTATPASFNWVGDFAKKGMDAVGLPRTREAPEAVAASAATGGGGNEAIPPRRLTNSFGFSPLRVSSTFSESRNPTVGGRKTQEQMLELK